MSNTVKSKFAGLLRGLLRRMDRDNTSAPRPVVAAAPAEPVPAPVTASAPPARSTSAALPASVPPNENEIAVPLAPVIAGLPLELRAKITSIPAPGTTINLPIETVVSQLAFGAVKISFGELRQLAVGIFVNSGGELDNKTINLPLAEILARLNPALIARRSGSKVEVAEDISGPFGSRTNAVTFTSQPMKSPAPPPARAPIATDVNTRMNTPVVPPAAAPTMQPSAPITFRPQPGAGRFVTPTPLNGQSAPTAPANGHHGTNGTNGANGNHGKNGSNGSNGGNGSNGHHAPVPSVPYPVVPPAPAPKLSAAPAPVPTPAPAPVAPRPEPAQPTIHATLWELAENWPQELKDEISRNALTNLNVPLAGNVVGPGMKRGRITMTWKNLRSLVKPSSMPSPNDGLELELPLKVIAPLFFAALKNAPTTRKATTVSSEIPNLFFGFPQTAATPPVPLTPAALPAAKPVEKKPAESNSNFYVWGENGEVPKLEADYAAPAVPNTDFTSRRAMPKDVVAKAMTLPGVAGTVITLPDGLRVASEVSAEFNADTLAAFIPQMFERMNQSARELRMGSLNNVSFTVGNVPWRIIRVNAVYLAAFGRAGGSLPTAELAGLAEELDRKK